MKRNQFINSLVFLLLVICLFGCKKSDESFDQVLMLNTDYLVVTGKSNTYSFDLLANQDITLSTDVDWIYFETAQLTKGKHAVKFTTKTNDDEERSGIITIQTTPDVSREILVVQEAGLVNIFYVKTNGTGNGRSWNDATNLNTALQNATSGSVIHLAEGIYIPTKTLTNGEPSNLGDNTFEINKNISLIGGYPANATEGTSADPQIHKTILSGKQTDGATSFHVVTISAPTANNEKVVIEGVTIQDGVATDRGISITINGNQFSRGNGGGMIIGGSNVLLKHVEIIDNKADAHAGTAGQCAGLYVFGDAQVEMRNCKVNQNHNENNNGGGLWVSESKAYIFDSEMNNNYAKGTASGVHAYPNAVIYMYNSSIQNNNNTSFGAGIYARQNSNIFLVNCLITGNATTSANGGGGVMLYDNCTANIISCTISANTTPGPGGGVYRRQNTNKLTLTNSIVSGNIQRSSSTDVDAYETTAEGPAIKSSILTSKVYNSAGMEITGATFNPNQMFDSEFHLIGTDNPAQTHGMTAAELQPVSQSYTPALSEEILSDIHGISRVDKPTMGALVN